MLDLSKEDIASVITLIDVAAQRGAIQGSEMSIIGAMRVKFETVLKTIVAAEEENTPAE